MVTGRILRLSPVVYLQLKTFLVGTVANVYKLRLFFEVTAFRGHMVAAVVDSAVCAFIHDGTVRLVLLARGRPCYITYYVCPQVVGQMAVLT